MACCSDRETVERTGPAKPIPWHDQEARRIRQARANDTKTCGGWAPTHVGRYLLAIKEEIAPT